MATMGDSRLAARLARLQKKMGTRTIKEN
jgi:hypothetical protein